MTNVTPKLVDPPLLTIIIPTYNRAANLSLLLRTLKVECAALEGAVTVLVSDNASTDRTSEVTHEMQAGWSELVVQRHARNCGPEENFCTGIDRVESRYFWIIGDDDCPKRGVVTKLVALLRAYSPALVYVQSEWINPIIDADQGEPIGTLRAEILDSVAFARKVHIWITFISGSIVDRTAFLRKFGAHAFRRFTNTSLVQLGWLLPLVQSGERLVYVVDRCVLATKDNSGGYALLTVFGINFPRVTNEALGAGSQLARLLVGGTVTHYLPGLIWGARIAPSGRHVTESPWPGIRQELGHRALFWLLLVPLGRFPMWLAWPLYQLWRVLLRVSREIKRLSARRVSAPGGADCV